MSGSDALGVGATGAAASADDADADAPGDDTGAADVSGADTGCACAVNGDAREALAVGRVGEDADGVAFDTRSAGAESRADAAPAASVPDASSANERADNSDDAATDVAPALGRAATSDSLANVTDAAASDAVVVAGATAVSMSPRGCGCTLADCEGERFTGTAETISASRDPIARSSASISDETRGRPLRRRNSSSNWLRYLAGS
jgi:hypothetical protein